jgi:hypothetical protein
MQVAFLLNVTKTMTKVIGRGVSFYFKIVVDWNDDPVVAGLIPGFPASRVLLVKPGDET